MRQRLGMDEGVTSMSDDRDVPRWAVPLFWVVFIVLLVAAITTGGGCYDPEWDRKIECPPEHTGD
jgi:hypothetical protein